jgi:hypothetical protein
MADNNPIEQRQEAAKAEYEKAGEENTKAVEDAKKDDKAYFEALQAEADQHEQDLRAYRVASDAAEASVAQAQADSDEYAKESAKDSKPAKSTAKAKADPEPAEKPAKK